jgi:predicted ester cyclase
MSTGTEFVNRWMETVIKGDVEGLIAMCRPDVDLVNPDGSVHGPQGVRAAFEPIIGATSERAVEIRSIVEEGDTVVADFVFRFRNTGPLQTPQGTIPPTGKNASLPSIGTYVLRDGKLAYSHGEYDRMSVLAQLGLLPAPVQAS